MVEKNIDEILLEKSIDKRLVFAIRVVLASIWIYNGLWLKVILLDEHHLAILRSVGNGLDAVVLCRAIGSCETLLACGILSGLFYRFVSYFQIGIILLMNVIGSLFGGGTIAHPFGLIISNLPTIMCALIVARYGPGDYAITLKKNDVSSI
ncbi:MAG TPA: DoxX-like family protein [Drouetiella sp.]|jgi:uncharacterized membrane protein YphA (DoxX/SURF4 family)